MHNFIKTHVTQADIYLLPVGSSWNFLLWDNLRIKISINRFLCCSIGKFHFTRLFWYSCRLFWILLTCSVHWNLDNKYVYSTDFESYLLDKQTCNVTVLSMDSHYFIAKWHRLRIFLHHLWTWQSRRHVICRERWNSNRRSRLVNEIMRSELKVVLSKIFMI